MKTANETIVTGAATLILAGNEPEDMPHVTIRVHNTYVGLLSGDALKLFALDILERFESPLRIKSTPQPEPQCRQV